MQLSYCVRNWSGRFSHSVIIPVRVTPNRRRKGGFMLFANQSVVDRLLGERASHMKRGIANAYLSRYHSVGLEFNRLRFRRGRHRCAVVSGVHCIRRSSGGLTYCAFFHGLLTVFQWVAFDDIGSSFSEMPLTIFQCIGKNSSVCEKFPAQQRLVPNSVF